jgi:hypothetical protein
MIPFRGWNSYLKNLYESYNVLDNIPRVSTNDEVFSIEDIKLGVK